MEIAVIVWLGIVALIVLWYTKRSKPWSESTVDAIIKDDKACAEKGTKPNDVPKNISEPVTAFCRIVRENPKRFSIKIMYNPSMSLLYTSDYFTVKDKHTGKFWSVLYSQTYKGDISVLGMPEWVTKDEQKYIVETFKDVYKEKRKERLHQIQRERMKRVYK